MLYYRRHKSPHKDHCSTLVGTGATGVMSFVSTKWVWPEFISVSACINCDLRRSNIRQMISTFYILPIPPCPKMPSEQALDSLTIKGPKQQIHSKSYADSVPAKVDVTKPWPQLHTPYYFSNCFKEITRFVRHLQLTPKNLSRICHVVQNGDRDKHKTMPQTHSHSDPLEGLAIHSLQCPNGHKRKQGHLGTWVRSNVLCCFVA